MSKPKAVKYKWPSEREFERLSRQALAAYAPPVMQCRECGHAVIEGYCCHRCGYGEGGNYAEYRPAPKEG